MNDYCSLDGGEDIVFERLSYTDAAAGTDTFCFWRATFPGDDQVTRYGATLPQAAADLHQQRRRRRPRRGTVATSPLRAALDSVIAEEGCSLTDLTVLAPQNDPFRLDTPARHRDGQWLADTAAELGLGDRKIHLRGLHYMVLGRTEAGRHHVREHRQELGMAARRLRARPPGSSATSRSSRSPISATPSRSSASSAARNPIRT